MVSERLEIFMENYGWSFLKWFAIIIFAFGSWAGLNATVFSPEWQAERRLVAEFQESQRIARLPYVFSKLIDIEMSVGGLFKSDLTVLKFEDGSVLAVDGVVSNLQIGQHYTIYYSLYANRAKLEKVMQTVTLDSKKGD